MKKILIFMSICFGVIFFWTTTAQAARTCFCDNNGCSTGDGMIVSRSTCNSVNGKHNDNFMTPEDRSTYEHLYDYDEDRPPWLDENWGLNPEDDIDIPDLDVTGRRHYLQRLLEKQKEELAEINAVLGNTHSDLVHTGDYYTDYSTTKKDLNEEIDRINEQTKRFQDDLNHARRRWQELAKDQALQEKYLKEAEQKLADNESRFKSVVAAGEKELADMINKLTGGSGDESTFDTRGTEAWPIDLKLDQDRRALQDLYNDRNERSDAVKFEKRLKLDQELKVQAYLEMIGENHKERQAVNEEIEKLDNKFSDLNDKANELSDSTKRLQKHLDNYKKHQVKNNDAPDADRYFGLKNISLSIGASGSTFKDDRAASGSKGGSVVRDLEIGIRLSQRFSLSPGISFGNSDTDDDSGGGSDTKSTTGQIGFFWGPFRTPYAWFDGNVSHTSSEIATDAVGSAGQLLKNIEYDSKSTGVGIGINGVKQLGQKIQLEGRFGWSAAFSNREAYEDSANITHLETDTTIHRFSLGCRLVKPMNWGQFSLSSSVKYVGSDNSSADQDDKPFDANLGLGISYNITDNFSLSSSIGCILGRQDYQEYNGSLNLKINF
jgi:hypothetical protein